MLTLLIVAAFIENLSNINWTINSHTHRSQRMNQVETRNTVLSIKQQIETPLPIFP
jgi:hypothetical protein